MAAAAAFPESFRDPQYAALDASYEQKLGLPPGMLSSIRVHGERSNASQVSEAGAKTVYQIIPATRKAAIEKFGIDPYLNPQNAAEVAGLLLKESLDRNKGDAQAAVGEYIGGTDRRNWGPVTQKYIERVAGGMQQAKTGALENGFAAWMEANPAAPAKAEPKAPAGNDALDAGFGAWLKQTGGAPRTGGAAIPTAEEMATGAYTPPIAAPATPASGVLDQVIGAGEAGLSAVTGMTGGTVGMIGGGVKGLAEQILSGQFGTPQAAQAVEQAAAEGASALTYQPRTPAGQAQAEAVGSALQQALPALPLTAELGALARGTQPLRVAAGDAARAVPRAAADAAGAMRDAVRRAPEPAPPTPGTMGSVGAAGADMAVQRQALAADLPVPVQLTKGQAERSFEQLRFEQETAKNPGLGAPLRERYATQNEQILKNFDAWVDQTGAEAPSLRAVGAAVDKALVERAARDKAEIRVAYKSAEKAGEMLEPVATDGLAQLLNESASAEAVAPVLSAAKKELVRLGGASLDEAGNLVPGQLALGDMELMRRFLNRTAGADPTNIKYAGDLKRAIDASTEGLGGDLYKRARGLRQRYAQNYEDRATVAKLLESRRGTSDRAVAFEDVFNHAILKGSLDDVRNVRRVLQRAGDDGQQAWRELQGSTMGWIRDEATRGVSNDQRGNPIVSAAGLNRAIRSLDHDGKLEFVFGKKGAQQLRDVNDLAKVVHTVPPGAVNTSNTASVLLAALAEAGTWGGATGLPVPVLTGLRQIAIKVKDRRIQKRVEEALQTAKLRARGETGGARRVAKTQQDETKPQIGETIH